MSSQLLSILSIFIISGCTFTPPVDSIQKTSNRNELQNNESETSFPISFPAKHSGPFKSVDQMNFIIEKGKYKGNNASAVLAKSRKTSNWKVLALMIEENGTWIHIPISTK